MPFLFKLVLIQIAILLFGHLSMFPGFPIAEFITRKFGTYERGLFIVNGTQLILILITFLIFVWTKF